MLPAIKLVKSATCVMLQILAIATIDDGAKPISIPIFKETVDHPAHARVKREPSAGINVELTCVKRNLNYAYIEIGHIGGSQMNRMVDPQRFKVAFDTGSLTMWVPLDNDPLEKKLNNKYNASKGQPTTYIFDIQYGRKNSNSTKTAAVGGMCFKDSICIKSLCAKNVYIGAAASVSMVREVKFDGVMGMANFNDPFIPKWATDDDRLSRQDYSVLAQIFNQNKLPNIFSFWLRPCGGMLTLGGFDSQYYRGNVNYISIIPNPNLLWLIPGKDAYLQFGQNYQRYNFKSGMLDTGHEFILADNAFVTCLNSSAKPDNDGLFECSRLKSMPNVIFVFHYHEVKLTPKDYVFEFHGLLIGYCALVFQALKDGEDTWVLGERFMRNTYTIFDADSLRVGFADLEQPKKPESRKPWF